MLFERLLERAPFRGGRERHRVRVPKAEISASQERCRRSGLPLDLRHPRDVLQGEALAAFLAAREPLRTSAERVLRGVHEELPDDGWAFIFCNRHGRALTLVSSRKMMGLCIDAGIQPGTSFREGSCGTNAIALAMRLGRMVVIRGSDHYCALFEDWSCIAAPVRRPGGEIAGYLDLSLHHEEGLGYARAIFELTLDLLQRELAPGPVRGPGPVSASSHDRAEGILTERQMEALELYAKGFSKAGIARRMGVSEATVDFHLKEARALLEAKNTRAAVWEALRRGLMRP